jgi:hypothetical protein
MPTDEILNTVHTTLGFDVNVSAAEVEVLLHQGLIVEEQLAASPPPRAATPGAAAESTTTPTQES